MAVWDRVKWPGLLINLVNKTWIISFLNREKNS